jgi:hypothetical protein
MITTKIKEAMMDDVTFVHIPEYAHEDKRLGRHVEHDPRSREFAVGISVPTTKLKSVHHRRYGGIFNQGNVGSCTGNAMAGALNTAPLHKPKTPDLKEADAVALYSLATRLDSISGTYPPQDTGSSGLAVAKAAKQEGHITAYHHAFSIEEALSALQSKPVITGTEWFDGFDHPDANGLVVIAGEVRGGHEYVAVGFELAGTLDESLVIFDNSWGTAWGKTGKFSYTVATWRQLLANQGDVTIVS